MFRLFVLFIVLLFNHSFVYANEAKTKFCTSLKDCRDKYLGTSIHRKKINFLTDAIENYSSKLNENEKAELYLERARSIVLEASGDTGYRGEIQLKVTHKPEYKNSQMQKAKSDLDLVIGLNQNLSESNKAKYREIYQLYESSL
ncbi:MAG: hypothetical protein O9301_11815 [Leptospira sp.]|nr:hypothetical protein [Leptospira sp.]